MSIVRIIDEIADEGLGTWDAKPFLEKVTGVVPGIIYIFNQKTQSNEYSNRSLGELLGFKSFEIQAMGDDFFPQVCHPEDLPKVFEYFGGLQSMQDGEVSSIEYRMRHKSGHWVWLLSYDSIFERNADGTVLRHIGQATDITAQKDAEVAAIEAKNVAESANSEIKEFTYAISHELRAPTVTLEMVFTELNDGHAGPLSEDAKMLISQGLGTLSRMQKTIADTLEFTQIIETPPRRSNVDLNTVLSDVTQDLHAVIQSASAQVNIAPLPKTTGDDAQLRILFSNLVSNAIKYTSASKTAQVEVFEAVSSTSGAVDIVVADNGIGIPPECAEDVFKLYWRGHGNDEFEGNGLGLALCRRIALAHGGHVAVDHTAKSGSRLVVSLPRYIA